MENVLDKYCGDEWAKWLAGMLLSVIIDGQEQLFYRLSDAMKAHDDCVLRKNGPNTKCSYLNIADNCPWLFPDAAPQATNDSEGGTNNDVTPMSAKSTSGIDVKQHETSSEESKYKSGDDSSEESRFSDVEIVEEDEREEIRDLKRRRLNVTSEATSE